MEDDGGAATAAAEAVIVEGVRWEIGGWQDEVGGRCGRIEGRRGGREGGILKDDSLVFKMLAGWLCRMNCDILMGWWRILKEVDDGEWRSFFGR